MIAVDMSLLDNAADGVTEGDIKNSDMQIAEENYPSPPSSETADKKENEPITQKVSTKLKKAQTHGQGL